MATRSNVNNLNKCMTQVLPLSINITVGKLVLHMGGFRLSFSSTDSLQFEGCCFFLSTSKEVLQVSTTFLYVLNSPYIYLVTKLCCFVSHSIPDFLGCRVELSSELQLSFHSLPCGPCRASS
jgi:hypothetical protein